MFVQLWDTDMKNHKIEQCPCGQQQTYAQCCAPYHQGTAIAPTAELLMRSRYSAYVLAIKEYLLSTWHESTRPKKLTFNPQTVWLGLKIKHCIAGTQQDEQGTVQFVARYKIQGKAHRLIENSRFVKQQGHWFYIDGDIE